MACTTSNPPSKLFLPLVLFLLLNYVGSAKTSVSVNHQFLNAHKRVMSTKNSVLVKSQFLNTHIRVTSMKNRVSVNSQFLSAHNKVRARHNIPPLIWSAGLAGYAKRYANERRGDCALVHSTGDYGENIFWGQGNNAWKAADAVAAWAEQEGYYDYKRNRCEAGKECLHYTQVVWRKTLKVGCARIRCGSGDAYVVCEYYPHGNVIGERPY